MLLDTLCASLLGNILAGKGAIRAGDGAIAKTKARSKRQGKGILRAGLSHHSFLKMHF